MYEEQREDRGNNLLGNVVIGAGLLGAGALGANYARSVFKNRNRKAQQVNVNVEQPTGRSNTQMRDLSQLPSQTKAGVYKRANQKYPDPGVGKDVQYRNPGSGGTDLSMLITDPNTGEIYRRGGGQTIKQQEIAPKNQGGGINLSKQNLMGQGSLTTDQMLSFGQRKSKPDVDYVRGRIAKDLEAGVQSAGPSVQLRSLPPADRVAQLLSEVGVDERGAMTAGREVAQEAAQMAGTESSRQSAAVRRMEKQDPEFERIAKDIIAEMRGGGGQGVAKQPKPSGDGGPKLAGYSEGPVDAADQQNIRAARQQQPETLVELRETSAPFVRDAQNEAIQTANDQSDSKFFKNLQRNEDVDLTIVNEDILDKQKARAFDQLVADAERYTKDKQIESEIDLKYDYSSEEARQAADVGAALERIRNNPKRLAAEGIISELQAEGRAERDLARFQSEGESGGELPGLKAEDNIRQRSEQQGSRSMTGEQLEEVLLGESKVVDKNMRGRELRGGKVNEEGNYFTAPGTVTYVGEGGAETGDFRDASTGIRTDIPFVASGSKTPEGAASILASEAIRKKYQDQRPEPLKGPAADVARSMQTLREGMSVEPSELPPSTQVPTINRAGYADGEVSITVPAETQFTGDAVDAAGPVLFTGKNKRDSAVVGTSPPLVQETIVANPQAAAANEGMAQSFLEKAISGGLTQKTTPTVEVYETPRLVGPAEVAGPGSVPLSRSAVADPELGPDPSQRTGYARYVSGSKPVGTPSTGAMTVGINYAELPQSDASYFSNRDIGRAPYRGPVQTFAERLDKSTGGTARPMSMLPDRGDGQTTISKRPPAYNPRMKLPDFRPIEVVSTPKAVMPVDAGPVRKSYPADPNQTYAPQALAGRQASVVYPRMRGEALFPEYAIINNPDLRGGPVKFEGRERREDEYVRPISERLGRGDTMQRFPIIRRG